MRSRSSAPAASTAITATRSSTVSNAAPVSEGLRSATLALAVVRADEEQFAELRAVAADQPQLQCLRQRRLRGPFPAVAPCAVDAVAQAHLSHLRQHRGRRVELRAVEL